LWEKALLKNKNSSGAVEDLETPPNVRSRKRFTNRKTKTS
jgi:hypothetical protein